MSVAPYIVSNWVREAHFYGRAELCRSLVESPERCIYLVGTRRIGKTSLLMRLTTQLQPYGLYCDLMRAAGSDMLDETRLVTLMRRQLTAQAPQSEALRESRPIWDREVADLCGWLDDAAWRWAELGVTITLLWDEAELLRRLPDTTLMPLRAILQHSPGLRIIICASKALADLNDRWRDEHVSPFLFGFATAFIAGLSDSEADELLRQRGAVTVTDEVAGSVRAWSGNHPFLLQLLGSRLFEGGQLRAPLAQDLLVDTPLAELFRSDVRSLSPGEQAILAALATHGPLGLAALAQHTALTPEAAQSFVVGLARVGLLREHDQNRWEAGNALLARWLRSSAYTADSAVSDQASLALATSPQRTGAPTVLLSTRERSVLRLVAAGQTNQVIARELMIAPDTVKAHLKNIMSKLEVSNRAHAVARAKELGLL